MTSLNDEARKCVLDALDALRQWSNEIAAVNDRCSTKAIARIAAAQKAMGWPDHVTTSHSVPPGTMHYLTFHCRARQPAAGFQTADRRDRQDRRGRLCLPSDLILRDPAAGRPAAPALSKRIL